MLQKKSKEVLNLMESDIKNIPLIFSLAHYDGGIKMIKFFSQLYSDFAHIDVLFTDLAR